MIVHLAAWPVVAKLDEPTGHPFGMGPTFIVLCLFFVAIFVIVAAIGNWRSKRRGPQLPPEYPVLRDKPRKPGPKSR